MISIRILTSNNIIYRILCSNTISSIVFDTYSVCVCVCVCVLQINDLLISNLLKHSFIIVTSSHIGCVVNMSLSHFTVD